MAHRFQTGPSGMLALAFLTAAVSGWLILTSQATPCEARAPLTVVAMLAAFVIALGFRLMATSSARLALGIGILIAAIALLADVHFVIKTRDICHQLEQQLHRLNRM